MHTVPGITHWPPVPLRERRPTRRPPAIALDTEFRHAGATCRARGCGATVSEAILDARSSIVAPGDWRLARFFPAESAAA